VPMIASTRVQHATGETLKLPLHVGPASLVSRASGACGPPWRCALSSQERAWRLAAQLAPARSGQPCLALGGSRAGGLLLHTRRVWHCHRSAKTRVGVVVGVGWAVGWGFVGCTQADPLHCALRCDPGVFTARRRRREGQWLRLRLRLRGECTHAT
jgi:hypothetical protein